MFPEIFEFSLLSNIGVVGKHKFIDNLFMCTCLGAYPTQGSGRAGYPAQLPAQPPPYSGQCNMKQNG
jgi:hypothetical protein